MFKNILVPLDGSPVAAAALPYAQVLAARMGEADGGADGEVELSCPACQHGWSAELDIAAFFWTEIAAQAQRLLREVDALARVYGWREADILAMSAARRQAYLELVAG